LASLPPEHLTHYFLFRIIAYRLQADRHRGLSGAASAFARSPVSRVLRPDLQALLEAVSAFKEGSRLSRALLYDLKAVGRQVQQDGLGYARTCSGETQS
jgi:hypothetical protein